MSWALAGAIGSAVFGGISGGASDAAANKAAKAAHKQAKADWEYQNEQAERDIDFKRELNEVQRWNNFQNAQYQDQSALQNWQMTIDQQMFDFGNRLQAKQVADRTMNQQLGLNKKATDLAVRQQENWMRERGIEKDFALKTEDLYMVRAEDTMDAAYQDILMNRQKEAVRLEGAMVNVQAKRNMERGMVSFKAQENMVDGLIAAGAAQNRQAGRSGDKGIQSAIAATGRAEERLRQEATNIFQLAGISMIGLQQDLIMNNTHSDIMREQVGQDFINKSNESYMRKEMAVESYNSAVRQNNLQHEVIQHQGRQADLDTWGKHYMLQPQLGPQPAPPFATPLPYILDPRDHVWSPKPVKGATSTGGATAGFLGGLSGIIGAL